LKKIRGYDPRLIQKIPEHLEPYAMLDIFSYVHDAVAEVKEIQENEVQGSVLIGIGRALGTALQETAKAGSTVIKAIGGAIKDVFDGAGDLDEKVVGSFGDAASKIITSTGGAIKDTGTGIGNIFHGFFGGIGGTIKWALILIIIMTIVYLNRSSIMTFIRKKRKKTHDTEKNEKIPDQHDQKQLFERDPRQKIKRRKRHSTNQFKPPLLKSGNTNKRI